MSNTKYVKKCDWGCCPNDAKHQITITLDEIKLNLCDKCLEKGINTWKIKS